MASRSSPRRNETLQPLDSDLLPLSDVLRFFNNPINEEQAWAVCYQCAQYYLHEHCQEKYQQLYEHGIECMCINREGEVHIHVRFGDPNGSGKGPPVGEYYAKRKRLATENDAVQMLGRIIFDALDYGIGEAEERPLSHGLEMLIDTMIRSGDDDEGTDAESQSADDEGIEKDSEEDHHCTFRDVARLCSQHLLSRQDAGYHYRAVCRALVAEAVELHTFLDKISSSREKLRNEGDEDCRLGELERSDWARLWVQVMRSLRQGVRLKKSENVNNLSNPPVEFELTPFEMLLEDIRSRRYTLHKIMVNGDIPPKVKNNAHAVILDFIRSRPPLRQVKDRKLKSLPPRQPDPYERLLLDIRSQPKLKPIKGGRIVVETSRTKISNEDSPPLSTRKVIKPDFNLLLSSSFEESEEDSEKESPDRQKTESQKILSQSLSKDSMNGNWHSGSNSDARSTKLQRRHTIMVCESPDAKLTLQELPPLEEEEEPSPEEQMPRLSCGSDSTLSGLPDHTMYNGNVLLRGGGVSRHQSPLYRSEHRRSLTSGLTAIPEVEDNTDTGIASDSSCAANRRHSMPSYAARELGRGSKKGAKKSVVSKCKENCSGELGGGLQSTCDISNTQKQSGSLSHWTHSHLLSMDSDGCTRTDDVGHDEDLAHLNASEMLHVSWKTACPRSATNSTASCHDCRPVPKRWQNPIECLSLTLEEVTHIRSVLTKAELESLISHPELYSLVSKSKVCFTCKTTRFTLFGEWGTKCKFCKRTICNKCMRKVQVPTEHFKNIPVYTLSPTPLTKEAQDLIQNYVRSSMPSSASSSPAQLHRNLTSVLDQQKGKRPLQRSQSLMLSPVKSPASSTSSLRGPVMSICCDCKGMIMEILRASKTTIAMLQPSSSTTASQELLPHTSSESPTSNC